MNYPNNDYKDDEFEEQETDDDEKRTTKCPNCSENAYTQYTCEFCGQTTCADCDTLMKPCLGCGRLVCHDCTEETLSSSGRRERICARCAEVMDKTTFDSYWTHGKKRRKILS